MSFFCRLHLSLFFALRLCYLSHADTSGAIKIDELLQPDYQGQTIFEDESKKSWTHTPKCADSISQNGLVTKYCVFTNDRILETGFSLITTSKAASQAARNLNEDSALYFFSESEAQNWYASNRPYRIENVPGKGKGVIATRKIKQYETFMIDQASVIMDLDLEKKLSKAENARLLKTAVDQLRKPESIRNLSTKRKAGPKAKGDTDEDTLEEDIMITNAFGTQLESIEVRGLFPVAARINHDCHPNSFVMFSPSGLSIGLKAYRDIALGEEISVSYIRMGMNSTQRAESLSRYGFTCTCELCSLSASEKATSDKQRRLIQQVKPVIASRFREGKYQEAIHIIEDVVELIKAEALDSMLPDEYVFLARLHMMREDREKAEEYADLALELLDNLGFLGEGGKEGWGVDELLKAFQNRGSY
ncbi:SET domain-containing protein [Lophiostoma macrostomum CBS 122681]|uniref:SET domain-containing protein n=1 Tax=Lophiostoma macrostomum CBS 122681 TaxID=1314788 RepID=A0A6A6TSD1_9PLEO|nr:SET domain-containing protein [Lophiostoma macrostomum CBS 122681]